MCHFRTLFTPLVFRISQVPLQLHNSIENTAVIPLRAEKKSALPAERDRPRNGTIQGGGLQQLQEEST
jgi:hypothetical protein